MLKKRPCANAQGRFLYGAGPEISFGKVNVDEAPELAQRYQISAIPTLLLFRDGEPVDVSVGVKSKAELEAFLK